MTLHFERKEFEVVHDPRKPSPEDLLAAVRKTDPKKFTPSLGPQAPAPKQRGLTQSERARLDVKVITHGKRVDLREHLVAGKFTIFDYYADWCGPCKVLSAKLERLALQRTDLAIRQIDIVNWKSPAARQATKAYRLRGLPYVRVYGPKGKFRGSVTGSQYAAVKALLQPGKP